MTSPFDVFLTPEVHINRARLDHLASLGLDLQSKRGLEVGAGIGLHASFFEERAAFSVQTGQCRRNDAPLSGPAHGLARS